MSQTSIDSVGGRRADSPGRRIRGRGGALLDTSVDDMDLNFLSDCSNRANPCRSRRRPLSTSSELVVSSPSGKSDTAESSDDDSTSSIEPAAEVAVQKHGPKPATETTGLKKVEERKARRRAQVAISARRHRSRKKVRCCSP
ncbi:hypothetical protein GQ600_23662 [Phytophthora cactorum]|nr:hypothetical protein GQ600_23662 [Phytophthora cactorum]